MRRSSTQKRVAKARRSRRAVSKTIRSISRLILCDIPDAQRVALDATLDMAVSNPQKFAKAAVKSQNAVRMAKQHILELQWHSQTQQAT